MNEVYLNAQYGTRKFIDITVLTLLEETFMKHRNIKTLMLPLPSTSYTIFQSQSSHTSCATEKE
jgi:hypothetical protein